MQMAKEAVRHNIIASGKGFAPERLVKRLASLRRGRTHSSRVRSRDESHGREPVDHVIQRLVVELKAEAVRVFDCRKTLKVMRPSHSTMQWRPFRAARVMPGH